MCEAGRILHHLKNNITESRNTVLVVGYMAKDTLGKKIVDFRATYTADAIRKVRGK